MKHDEGKAGGGDDRMGGGGGDASGDAPPTLGRSRAGDRSGPVIPGLEVGQRYVPLTKYAGEIHASVSSVRRWVHTGLVRGVKNGRHWYVVAVDPEAVKLRDTRAELARAQEKLRGVLEAIAENEVKLDVGLKSLKRNEMDQELARQDLEQLKEQADRAQRERDDIKAAVEVIQADYTSLREESEAMASKTDQEMIERLKKRLEVKPALLAEITQAGVKDAAQAAPIEPISIERLQEMTRKVLGAPGLRELGDWTKEPRRLAAGYAKFLETDDMGKVEKELVKVGKIAGDQLLLVCKLFEQWRKEKVPSYVVDMRG